MISPKVYLGHISGGQVLDVATGSGGFVQFLLEGLKDYIEIIGIDTNERAAVVFTDSFKEKTNIHFKRMDALHMNFPDASFDTVCIANSLHHFDEPKAVLREMRRVIRPGGHFILAEMYCDGQRDTQMTHVLLHHWWAAVDQSTGMVHNETYQREELIDLLSGIGLSDLKLNDFSDAEEDPKKPEILAELESIIDRYIQRAENYPDLQEQGENLRRRVREVGFHGATSLIAVGS